MTAKSAPCAENKGRKQANYMRGLTKAAFLIGKDHRRQITARIQCSTVFSLIPARASIAATYVISPSPRNKPEGDPRRELSSGKLVNTRQVKVKDVIHVEQRMSELRTGKFAQYAGIFDSQGLEKEADPAAGNLHGYLSLKPDFPF